MGPEARPAQAMQSLAAAARLTPTEVREAALSVQTRSNLLIFKTFRQTAMTKVLQLESLSIGDATYGVAAYPAAPADSCKGVIHGVPTHTSSKYLTDNLIAPGHTIITARMMGRTETALITYEGSYVPRTVLYCQAEYRCYPHRPKAQQCTLCHRLGHRADVCPQAPTTRICPTCSADITNIPPTQPHECSPSCLNFGEEHPSTCPTCPARVKADAKAVQAAYKQRLQARRPKRPFSRPSSPSPQRQAKLTHTRGRAPSKPGPQARPPPPPQQGSSTPKPQQNRGPTSSKAAITGPPRTLQHRLQLPARSRSLSTPRQYLIQNPNPYFRLETQESGDCIFEKSIEGEYTFISTGSDSVCALYVYTEPEFLVEFQILRFDVSCTKGGLLTVFDGWENYGDYFPTQEEHPKPMDQRFAEFCGPIKPWKPFTTSQNVGVVMFRVPTRGNYFSVLVTFRRNPKPCNVLLQPLSESPVYTLRNYGRRVNCSAAFIFPMNFRILATSIGSQGFSGSTNTELETGLITKCKKRGMQDYAQFLGGNGISTEGMLIVEDICGLDSTASKKAIQIPCGSTAVRLVSSGRYEDSLTFGYEPIIEIERLRSCAKTAISV